MEVLEVIPNCTDADWPSREIYWIAHYRSIYPDLTNLDSGGKSGFLKSERTRELMSQRATGRVMDRAAVEKMRAAKRNPSNETRANLRAAQLGKKQSIDTRQKRSRSMMGRIVSTETRARISLSKKGKPCPMWQRLHLSTINKGRIPSAETRAKISMAHKGRKPSPQCIAASVAAKRRYGVSPETRAKISAALTGRRLSDEEKTRQRAMRPPVTQEARDKIGAAHRGRKQSPEQIAKRVAAFRLTWHSKRRFMSAETRARMAAGQRLRRQKETTLYAKTI